MLVPSQRFTLSRDPRGVLVLGIEASDLDVGLGALARDGLTVISERTGAPLYFAPRSEKRDPEGDLEYLVLASPDDSIHVHVYND